MASTRAALVLGLSLWFGPTAVGAELQLKHLEAAHGELGPLRSEQTVLPYDQLFFRYSVAGLELDDQGQASVTLETIIENEAGEVVFRDRSQTTGALPLGGGEMPAMQSVSFDEEAEPGDYNIVIRATDDHSGQRAEARLQATLLPIEYAIVRPRFWYDEAHGVAAPVGGRVGQTLYFDLRAIGFDRSQDRIDVEMNVHVLDADGEPMMPQPIQAALASDEPDVVATAPFVTFSGQMTLNREGEYTLRIEVHDNSSDRNVEFTTPLVVQRP